MERNRRQMGGVAAGVLGAVLALAACGGGSDSGTAVVARSATTVTTAAAVADRTPTAAGGGKTQTGRAGDAPAPNAPGAPVPPIAGETVVDRPGMAHLVITPDVAAPGERVRLEGDGFTGETYKVPGPSLWLNGPGPTGCNLYAESVHSVIVSEDGRITGEFIVPFTGECRQGDVGEVPVGPGRYDIVFGCTVCTIGSLEVVAEQVPPLPGDSVACDDVAFEPNSENSAYNIVATGISCADAEAFVRRIGAPLGPVNGAARVEAEGFTCARVSESIGPLPTASYECGRGETRITFDRS